jgi:hypothetical protein
MKRITEGIEMKRKTYMIFLIMTLVCLSACTVQAMTYENCHVIAVGKAVIDISDGVKTPYKGYLSYPDFYNCSMLVIVILPANRRPVPGEGRFNIIFAHPTILELQNATGTFIWNSQHGTYINAEATTAVLEWGGLN